MMAMNGRIGLMEHLRLNKSNLKLMEIIMKNNKLGVGDFNIGIYFHQQLRSTGRF